jgi:hypothetical protein
MVLGPADWTHGISRSFQNVVADPNLNLTVPLFRQPVGEWVGVRPQPRWLPAAGSGVLLDLHGEIGRASMSVIPVRSRGRNRRQGRTGGKLAA